MSATFTCDVRGCGFTSTSESDFLRWQWWFMDDEFIFCKPHSEGINGHIIQYLTRMRDEGVPA